MVLTFKAYAAGRVLQLVDQGRHRLAHPHLGQRGGHVVAVRQSPSSPGRARRWRLAEVCVASLRQRQRRRQLLRLAHDRRTGKRRPAFAPHLGHFALDRREPSEQRHTRTRPRHHDTAGALSGLPAVRLHRNSAELHSACASHLGRVDARANVTSGPRFRAAVPGRPRSATNGAWRLWIHHAC